MRTEEPRAVRLQDYRAPDFTISEIALDFALDAARDARERDDEGRAQRRTSGAPLVLNGERLKLLSVAIDGKRWRHPPTR